VISLGYEVRASLRGITDLIGWVLPNGIKRCLCGSDEVLWVQEDYTIETPKWKVVVTALIFQRCSLCKETYLGHKAMQRIEKATEWARVK